MVWKDYIVTQFDLIDRSTMRESDLYGAYNTLLQDLFPASEYYQVAPQFSQIIRSADDTVVSFVVLKWKTPVFLVEIKTFVALELPSARAAADNQMRAIFVDFSDDHLPQSKLIGLSAMGTRFAVYEYTTKNRRLHPPRILDHPDIVTDTAPKGRWSDDIMEDSGEANFKALVNAVKEMASAIGGVCECYFLRYSRPFTD